MGRLYVSRCERCHGIRIPEGVRRLVCEKCGGQDSKAIVDAATVEYVEERDVRVPVVTDRYMEGVRALDGVDIGSRRKRRDYMRARDLVDFDDLKGVNERAAKERAERLAGTHEGDKRERREALERAWHKLYRP